MNNIDRFLRILYKDCNLRRLFQVYEDGGVLGTCFTLDNPICRRRIISDYQWIYPNNYNEDVLEHMLEYYKKDSKAKCKKCSPLAVCNQCPKDAIFLLCECVNKMLIVDSNSISVRFQNIREWDGLINKLDSNILIGLKCALDSLGSNLIFYQEGSVLSYKLEDSDKLKLSALSENHMHLKGSGYTTEMSIQAILHSPITSVDRLENELGKLRYDDRVLGMTGEEAAENLRKIMLFRLFLVDMQSETPLFSSEERKSLVKNKQLYLQKDMANNLDIINTSIETEHDCAVITQDLLKKSPTKRYFVLSRLYFYKAFFYLFSIIGSPEKFEKSGEFLYILNMYIAGVSKLRFLFAQDNTGMGFTRFKRYEDRKTEVLGNISIKDRDLYESVFDKYTHEGNIKKVELRIAPPSSGKAYSRLCKELGRLESLYSENNVVLFQYGFVVHFIKPKDSAEFETVPGSHRYERYLKKQEKNMFTLLSLLERNNDFVSKIVGIDTANYELNCPPEVFAGIFQELKSCALTASKRRLFLTYHVGEDFRSIVTGLRRIDEAIEFLEMETGDRLGHALAAGLDLDRYFASSRNYITSTKQEWLDDLAWMFHMLLEEPTLDIEEKAAFCEFLRLLFDKSNPQELMESEQPALSSLTIADYYKSISKRGKWIACKDQRESLESDSWLNAYFNNKFFYNQGQTEIIQEVGEMYIRCAKIAQERVVRKIIEKDLVIEANPSSNRKISHISNNSDLPIIQMINKFSRQSVWNNFCINTDDSAIFQTNLNNEYMILYSYYKDVNGKQMIETLAEKSINISFIDKK